MLAKKVIDSSTGIDRALLRLLPDVFFHPVWVYFGEAGVLLLPDQIQSLLDAGDVLLSAGNLPEACQTLFICAFLQMRAGDYGAASSNIQRILILTEQHGLLQAACWATWGAAAVCVRRGWFRQAAEHLEHLQSLLEQQEWVLSSVIDLIRRALLNQTQAEITSRQALSSDAVLSSAFEQMLHWGTPHAARGVNEAGSTGASGDTLHAVTAPASPASFSWHSFWQTFKRIFKGELRLKWVEVSKSSRQPHAKERSLLIPAGPVTLLMPAAPLPSQSDQSPVPKLQSEPKRLPVSNPDQPVAPDQSTSDAGQPARPSITAHLLGTFSFAVNSATVKTWSAGKGRAVFKYMLAHHDQPIPRDVLMDAFWRSAGPEASRNSLNVALHGLRKVLHTAIDVPVIVFQDNAYHLNPDLRLWLDVDEFERHVHAGRRLEAAGQLTASTAAYELAISLYQGDFLADDPYEEWPVLTRERLRVAYLDTLDRLSQIYFSQGQYALCITLCQLILARDTCREDAHCRLMRSYSRQGQYHLALRQYQSCVEALREELNVIPSPATTQLYEHIRRQERI